MSDRILNVAATYSPDARRPPIPCRLVVDGQMGILYCGRPKLFGSEVPVGARLFEHRILDLDLEHSLPSGRSKHCFLDFTDNTSGAFVGRFRVLMSDAAQVCDVFIAWTQRAQQVLVREDMRAALVATFKAAGVVDLKRYVEENEFELEQSSPVGPELFDAWRARGEPRETGSGVLYAELVNDLERAIADGRLGGVIDRDKGEYRDRDFIVREQRVVHLNVAVDFNALVTQLGGKGIALQSIECPACGARTDGVPEGAYFVCGHCRTTVRAVDVFERFRGILG